MGKKKKRGRPWPKGHKRGRKVNLYLADELVAIAARLGPTVQDGIRAALRAHAAK